MDEMEALRAELEHYRAEKEKIRDIVGQIGGQAGRRRQATINVVFLALVLGAFAFDFLRWVFEWSVPFLPPQFLLELAVLLVSLKIIWMIHTQTKVDHFQFWILHSIEFQMSVLTRRLSELTARITPAREGPRDGDASPPSEGAR